MLELPDRYVFETLLDGRVFFHKKSYEEHADRHLLGTRQDRENIQEALIDPDMITKHDTVIFGKRFRHHTYYRFEQRQRRGDRAAYLYYWKVVIRMVGGSWRWCVVTAFLDARTQRTIINQKEERIIYRNKLI